MIILRKLLFPFAILYGIVTSIRNFLYDKGILKSYSFRIPIIAVGNLSVGGTGKTPQIEYLIDLLSSDYKVAVLSRGYKRKSKGFILANETVTAELLGDEPFQIFQKFPQIQVAVDADRKNGIEQLLKLDVKPEVILLDDAFQHRRVKAGFYVLLTAYGDLYCDDFMLPTGNLREAKIGAKRADIIIVTKCPKDLNQKEQAMIKKKIGAETPIYFSCIKYDSKVYSKSLTMELSEVIATPKVLLAGIAKPDYFFTYLQSGNDKTLSFPDHHNFSAKEITLIKEAAKNKIIVTTEKDFVRLKDSELKEQLYYLPIKSDFLLQKELFDTSIQNFIQNFNS